MSPWTKKKTKRKKKAAAYQGAKTFFFFLPFCSFRRQTIDGRLVKLLPPPTGAMQSFRKERHATLSFDFFFFWGEGTQGEKGVEKKRKEKQKQEEKQAFSASDNTFPV